MSEATWVAVNINDPVRVKLTPLGRQIIAQKSDQLEAAIGCHDYPAEEADGSSIWQLWHLMQVFGSYMGNGRPLAFETDIEVQPRR